MKTYSIIAVAAFAASFAVAGNAVAAGIVQGEATYDYPQATQATTSRAVVQAELQAARAAGTVVSGEASLLQIQPAARGSYGRPAQPTVAALPLNVEAISFDGRSVAQTNTEAEARLMARAAR